MPKAVQPFWGFGSTDEVRSYFQGRTAILASKHGKERAIAPVVEAGLGLLVAVADGFDTDAFGTFAGDVERPAPQAETAAMKATACLELFPEADLVLASEGAFYAHPDSPFLTMNTEIVLLMDTKTGIQVAGYHHSLEARASARGIESVAELCEFAEAVGFPAYGLILKAGIGAQIAVLKDFASLEELESGFAALHGKHGKIVAETDLRAHRNPLRMEKIGMAAQDLVRRLLSLCPQCGYPDFVVKDFEEGLPCELCGMPTRLPLKDILHCRHCGQRAERLFPKGEKAYAGHCDWCNP